MNDLDKSSQKDHQQAVKDWWNSQQSKEKWTGATYQDSWETHLHYWIRQKKTLEFIDKSNLPKDAKILELGFGGSETAIKILHKGYTYYGIDVSKHLCDHAKKMCDTYVKKNKAFFIESSLEQKYEFEDNFFDIVIICGAIHYAGNLTNVFSEVRRVLKKGGKFIIGQGNMYTLNDLINFRKFLKACIWYFTNETFQHSYSLSFRDMLLETKLKKYFLKYRESKFMNSKFMTNYSNHWKYKIHKRLFSKKKLENLVNVKNFQLIDVSGGPFLYSSKKKTSKIKHTINIILQFLLDKKILKYLINFADNVVVLSVVKK
tara:strand:+ start:374 stop:1324 length:951 start_codon:yes stop_codon:yes gene_type:complete